MASGCLAERLARVDRPSGTVHYYFSDYLGSASAITDSQGNVQQREYYYPYGGIVAATGSDPNHYKFTGKERDTESGLDEFGARYYSSSLGRFMIPDWAAAPTAVPRLSAPAARSHSIAKGFKHRWTWINTDEKTGECPQVRSSWQGRLAEATGEWLGQPSLPQNSKVFRSCVAAGASVDFFG